MKSIDVLIKFLRSYMGLNLKGPAYTNDTVIREQKQVITTEYHQKTYQGTIQEQSSYIQYQSQEQHFHTNELVIRSSQQKQEPTELEAFNEPQEIQEGYDPQIQDILLEMNMAEFRESFQEAGEEFGQLEIEGFNFEIESDVFESLEDIVNEPFVDLMDFAEQMPDEPMPEPEPPEPPDMFPDKPFPFGG